MTTKEKLLNELDNYRWMIMLQLADEAEERGVISIANGWRWLAENKRWPGPRINGMYGWLFKLDNPNIRSTHHNHRLPSFLNRDYGLPSTPMPLLQLLVNTAMVIGKWLEKTK